MLVLVLLVLVLLVLVLLAWSSGQYLVAVAVGAARVLGLGDLRQES